MLRVLQLAYPLAPVGPDAVGGAEQVLCHLERGLAARGHETIVVACEGSQVCGRLLPVPRICPPYDAAAIESVRARHAEAIRDALTRWRVALVHMHGFDFDSYLPPPGVPVLATLHCPPSWYSPDALRPRREETWLNAVSRRQHEELSPNDRLLPFVENGVPVEAFSGLNARRGFALVLARIAPEKGIREALEAARLADAALLVAGELFPYPEHQRYFAEEIAPLLDRRRRYLGPIGFDRKRRLLAAARCVVVPSLAGETSSLAAREALASGTPVVAFRRGALAETIEHGVTGFLADADDVTGLAAAMQAVSSIDPEACRAAARARFSLDRMVEGYVGLYREMIRRSAALGPAAEAAL
ncbi:MAG: glycosyltransferase [Hyphomicrobiaceae bacterium]|nr:glycosyltransferase [Hyphomicrobiaceae bacterium]